MIMRTTETNVRIQTVGHTSYRGVQNKFNLHLDFLQSRSVTNLVGFLNTVALGVNQALTGRIIFFQKKEANTFYQKSYKIVLKITSAVELNFNSPITKFHLSAEWSRSISWDTLTTSMVTLSIFFQI